MVEIRGSVKKKHKKGKSTRVVPALRSKVSSNSSTGSSSAKKAKTAKSKSSKTKRKSAPRTQCPITTILFETQLDFPQWKLETKAREDAREAGIAETLLRNLAERREMGVVHPIECCLALDKVIGDNSFMIADGGDFVGTASYILKPRRPLRWLDPGAFGTLGCGAGFGIGCKALNPDAEVWLLFGDGSFGWSVMECDTWKRMGLPLIAVVGNDACWSQMWRAQVRVLKDPCATELHYARYDKVAQAFGCVGLLVTKAEDLQPTFREAQRRAKAGKPVVVNVLLSKSTFRQGSISI